MGIAWGNCEGEAARIRWVLVQEQNLGVLNVIVMFVAQIYLWCIGSLSFLSSVSAAQKALQGKLLTNNSATVYIALELGKPCDVLGFLLSGCHRTDCARHTVLLPLAESYEHACAHARWAGNVNLSCCIFRNKPDVFMSQVRYLSLQLYSTFPMTLHSIWCVLKQ
jgi:hypothetical protein